MSTPSSPNSELHPPAHRRPRHGRQCARARPSPPPSPITGRSRRLPTLWRRLHSSASARVWRNPPPSHAHSHLTVHRWTHCGAPKWCVGHHASWLYVCTFAGQHIASALGDCEFAIPSAHGGSVAVSSDEPVPEAHRTVV